MQSTTLSAWMARQAADWADVVAYAHRWLQQPALDYWLEAEPAYFRRERDKAVAAGHWPRVGA